MTFVCCLVVVPGRVGSGPLGRRSASLSHQDRSVLGRGRARSGGGRGSDLPLSGNCCWNLAELDWCSAEHRRESLTLCGCSASPEGSSASQTVTLFSHVHRHEHSSVCRHLLNSALSSITTTFMIIMSALKSIQMCLTSTRTYQCSIKNHSQCLTESD